jgi:hypothetical protein
MPFKQNTRGNLARVISTRNTHHPRSTKHHKRSTARYQPNTPRRNPNTHSTRNK